MTECIKARQWLYRALRTAVQAAAGVVAAQPGSVGQRHHRRRQREAVAINARRWSSVLWWRR